MLLEVLAQIGGDQAEPVSDPNSWELAALEQQIYVSSRDREEVGRVRNCEQALRRL